MIEVELPDGTIAEIETDDENVARSTAQRYWDSQQRPPQAPIAGASRDDVARGLAPADMLGETAGGRPQVTTGTAPRPTVRSDNPLALGTQAVGAGLGDILGAPVDLATAGLNAGAAALEGASRAVPWTPNLTLGRIDNPIGGSRSIRGAAGSVAERAGFPLVDPANLPLDQRLLFRGIEDTAASVGGGQLMRGAARATRQMTAPRAPAGPIERMYDNAPVRATVTDAAAGAGMAAGETGAEAAGIENPIARTVAAFLGGMGGATIPGIVTAPIAAANTARRFMAPDRGVGPDPTTGIAPRVAVADEARRRMQEATVDPPAQVAQTIADRVRQYLDADMPVPTTGLISNDEGLIGMERGMRGNSPQMIRQDRRVNQAATEQVESTAPRGTPTDPDARAAVREEARTALTRQTTAERDFAIGQEAQARGAAEQALEAERTIGGQIAQRAEAQPGTAQRVDSAIVDETMRPMQAEQRRLYEAIPNTEVSTEPLIDLVRAIREGVPRTVPAGQSVPTEWLATLNRLAPETRTIETGVFDAAGSPVTRTETTGGTVGIAELNNMRPFLDTAQRQARQAGDFQLADNLGRLRRHIDEQVERLAASGGPGAAEAQAATRYTREEIAPRFGNASPEMADLRRRVNRDPANRSQAPREETARTFLGPQADSAEGALRGARLAEQVRRALAGSPSEAAGRAAARDYVLGSMRSVIGRDGRVDLNRLETWTRQNTGALRAFPELAQEATAMRQDIVNRRTATTRLQQDLETAAALRGQTEREIQNSAASLFLEAEPIVAVGRIMSNADPVRRMTEVVQRLRNQPDALAGLKTSVTDWIMQNATRTNLGATAEGVRNTSLAQIENLFTQHRRTLEALYGRGSREMTALENAHRAMTDMNRLGIRGVQGSETAPLLRQWLEKVGIVVRSPAAVGGFGAVTGGMIMRNVSTALRSIPAINNEAAIERIMQRAMVDPQLAMHLLTSNIPPARQPAWNRRLTELLAVQQGTTQE